MLDRRPFDPDERRRWLEVGRAYVEAAVREVADGQIRGVYQQVAHLAVACAEALGLACGGHQAEAFIDGLFARYPRHITFRRKLRALIEESPLLSPDTAQAGGR
ncbi:MAG: hypothetical protein ACRD0K_19960 [Egibacteraceae bacterium]